MAVIERDLDALVCHLRFPAEHRKRIRSTNLLERTFVEVRRRTKVIGRFPGETSALAPIWAVLELSSCGWRGIVMTPKAVAEIGFDEARPPTRRPSLPTEEVIAALGSHRSGATPYPFHPDRDVTAAHFAASPLAGRTR